MNLLLNLIWLVLGGFIVVIGYLLGAILLCITIVGIPFGIQCFKLAGLALAPFGREIREKEPPSGALAVIMNIIWIILPGLELAIMQLFPIRISWAEPIRTPEQIRQKLPIRIRPLSFCSAQTASLTFLSEEATTLI